MQPKKLRIDKRSYLTFVFLAIIILGLSAGIQATQKNISTRSKAADKPFVGCVGGGDWLCMCQLPDGEWYHDCATSDSDPHKDYVNRCGGDVKNAELQWRWDAATWGHTGNPSCCGGQNVCGSLIPTRGAGGGGGNFPPLETQPPIPTDAIPTLIPSPTFTYQVPTQPVAPTAIYIPPTNIPYIQPTYIPYIPPTEVINPTSTPKPVKPILNIDIRKNVEEIMNIVAKTQKSLVNFFSIVLP